MPKTKRPKKSSVSVSSTFSNDSILTRMNRISGIAAMKNVPESTETGNVLVTSTPEKKTGFIEIIKEIQMDHKAFVQMLLDDIAAFKENISLIKMKFPPSFKQKTLKSSNVYREKFAIESITEEDYINDPIPNNDVTYEAIHQVPSEDFRKPDITTTNLIQTAKRMTRSKLKTPHNPIPFTPITTITPKVNMNRPLSVLRHARVGEQAVSMCGSPIMVSSVPREDIATVSVPLHDGRVVTILPHSEFQREHMPSLDNETRGQLETLYRNLATIFEDSSDS